MADDFHEYLDDAPVSRYARLMATGAQPEWLARKLARQNAAELAALPDEPPAEHIVAFEKSARGYAARLGAVWDLPHHQYQDTVVTVGGMAGAACAEWHLHAYDLARALEIDYRPADPDAILAGWLAGMPHLPLPPQHWRVGSWHGRHDDPWQAVLAASGRRIGYGKPEPGTRRLRPSWAVRLRRRQKGLTGSEARRRNYPRRVPGAG